MRALLIIDMQNVLFTPMSMRHDAEGVIGRINLLSAKFRTKGLPVLFIQHDGSAENYCLPGTEEWEILPELKREQGDLLIAKTVNDAFYRTSLHETLQQMDVDEVVVTGCATDFCVDATVKSALTHDYRVTVIADGHTTANRAQMTAMLVIDYFNWLWSEFVPVNGKIVPVLCADFLKQIS